MEPLSNHYQNKKIIQTLVYVKNFECVLDWL